MNQLEAIKEAGYKAAKARRYHDEASANFHYQWAVKAIRLDDDPIAARRYYQEGYKQYHDEHPI